mmetsp:Transcript_17028/g.23399  ORF Transcript_17028/g.23399 Transcript_17028/m.23399 type:complete len:212 (-) Transcript_17028:363-998(-)
MSISKVIFILFSLFFCFQKASAIETGNGKEDFLVEFNMQLSDTESGSIMFKIHPSWAPKGADRFHELVSENFFTDVRFFRVISGFMAQFGISGDPSISSVWRDKRITDDPVATPNRRGTLSFATSGKDSRTTQLFVNFGDNTFLDSQGFSPIGEVIAGMEVVDALYSGYGEGAPSGNGPSQGMIQQKGNAYLTSSFPRLSYIKSARIVTPE